MDILGLKQEDLEKLIIVGDRVLIKTKSEANQTSSGLFLPPSVKEKEKIQSGYVVKVGPGYPIPAVPDLDESWKQEKEVQFVPLQPHPGDLAVYLQKSGYEVEFNKEPYILVPHSAILMLVRDEDIFE